MFFAGVFEEFVVFIIRFFPLSLKNVFFYATTCYSIAYCQRAVKQNRSGDEITLYFFGILFRADFEDGDFGAAEEADGHY